LVIGSAKLQLDRSMSVRQVDGRSWTVHAEIVLHVDPL
jgi:hypothetical protein